MFWARLTNFQTKTENGGGAFSGTENRGPFSGVKGHIRFSQGGITFRIRISMESSASCNCKGSLIGIS